MLIAKVRVGDKVMLHFTLFLLYRGLWLRVLGLFSVDEAGVPFTSDLLVFSLDFVFELSDFVLH